MAVRHASVALITPANPLAAQYNIYYQLFAFVEGYPDF
jgi:hypothetical protein